MPLACARPRLPGAAPGVHLVILDGRLPVLDARLVPHDVTAAHVDHERVLVVKDMLLHKQVRACVPAHRA